ncbi:FERM domain-containing protein 8-like [Sycon ciliatum]|uniref:FERM domain-containing protein 8-like n=1 Tax=Sycon ciliatum TaxID=27933 RepID=UPI0020AE0FFA|eukprot:scpid34891/ scgid32483/ FERM domain-containing protein 8
MQLTIHVFDNGRLGGRVIPVSFARKVGSGVKVVDVLREVFVHVDLPVDAAAIFSLWCTSPLLELQLKPNQKVQSVVSQWQALLAKYTTATVEKAEDDIPLLTLRRNCFYPRTMERKLLMEQSLRLLYHEAQFNITTYRYVPERIQDYYDLAAAKACIDLGLFDPQRHTVARMKEVVVQYFTPQFIRPRLADSLVARDPRVEVTKQWLREYQRVSAMTLPMVQLYRRYLQVCWNVPTYSAVFFKGEIACPRRLRRTLLDQTDVGVRVAINQDGIHLVHEEKNETLISFALDQVSWDYAPAQREGENEFASLYLEFDGEFNGTKCKFLVEVFSRQAQLMDAMISQCVEMAEEEEQRIAQIRRNQGTEGFVERQVIHTDLKRHFGEVQQLAKYVAVQTCVAGRCYPGLPKAADLAGAATQAGEAVSGHRSTHV